jgi:bifunctional DNA-binding transcriptional regulator/antitoxin component of YhaV-PrlF toxin-antitoxin module
MEIYKVQDCGCIALPEEVQRQTGLGPGATFQMIVAEDGSSVTLNSIHPSQSAEIPPGAVCGKLEPPAK